MFINSGYWRMIEGKQANLVLLVISQGLEKNNNYFCSMHVTSSSCFNDNHSFSL